jgi:5'-3' exonuclease
MPLGPVLLLDSASLYYRSFYALPDSMTAPDGRPHNAIRGFLSTITRLTRQYRPSAVVACWDEDWRPGWRVDLLPSYKTHRLESGGPESNASEPLGQAVAEQTPDALVPQAEAIAQIVAAMGLARPGSAGFEADDVIATLAAREQGGAIVAREQGGAIVAREQGGAIAAREQGGAIVVTGDRDLVQVVRPGVRLLLTVNGGMDKWPLLDGAAVIERFGVEPARYVDLAVLRGDPSDGIPGVHGIGPKTAVTLISHFGGLDGILAAVEAGATSKPLTPRLAGLLGENRDLIGRMRVVATARTDVPAGAGWEPGPVQLDDLADLGSRWGVTRFVDEALGAIASSQTVDE